MSTLNLKIDPEKVLEIPMVDLAFMVLKAANTPYYYRDLMKEVAKIRGMSDEEASEAIAQLYTEINIDGRFACVGTNLWGLKRWYPIEKSEDPVGNAKRPRIINDDDIEDDDIEDVSFTADGDGFDKVDDDESDDELFGEDEEEEVDVEEVEDEEDDSLLDDEELDDEEEEDEDSEDEFEDGTEEK